MNKTSPQQRHAKAAIKQEQSDASISSAEREQARRSAQHGGDSVEEYEAGDDCAQRAVEKGIPIQAEPQGLPGHPDLVLRKYRTCIFVNGCFWHGHHVQLQAAQMNDGQWRMESSACCKIPKTNQDFWVSKIRRNKERDKEVQRHLAEMGWHCITVWECQLKSSEREETLDAIAFTLNHIWLQDHSINPKPQIAQIKRIGDAPETAGTSYPQFDEEDSQMPMAAEERHKPE